MGMLRDSSKVLTGQAVQRILSFVLIPITARLISPADYGIVQAAFSLLGLASVVGGLALEASIPMAESKEQSFQQAIGTVIVGIFFSFLFCFGIYLLRPYLIKRFSISIFDIIFYLSPIFIPLTVANLSFRNYIGYLGKFNYFPITDIVSPIVSFIALIGTFLFFWQDYRCLLASGLIGMMIKLGIYLYAAMMHGRQSSWNKIGFTSIFSALWNVRSFAKYNLPSNLLNSASANLPTTLMALFFSESAVGLFTMARNIIYIPTTLSGQALGQVFYPKAAQAYREGKGLQDITWQTFVYSCQLALFPAFLITATAGFVLPLLLGSKWSGVSLYLFLILPMVLLNAVQTQIGIGFIFSILNQHYKILFGNALLFVSRFLPILLSSLYIDSPFAAVSCYALGGALSYAILLYWIFISVAISPVKAFYTWLKYCSISVICILPIGLVVFYNGIVFAILCTVLSIFLYGGIGWFKFLTIQQRSFIISGCCKRLPFFKRINSTGASI